MKHVKILNAYPIIKDLKKIRFNGKTALQLNRMEKELKEVYDFQMEEHQKLFKDYKPEYNQETNQLSFKTEDECDAFLKASNELDELEHEVKAPVVRIPIEKVPEISGDDMDKLEGLIEFYEEEEEIKAEDIQILPVDPSEIPAEE